jgi:hypothetical protein
MISVFEQAKTSSCLRTGGHRDRQMHVLAMLNGSDVGRFNVKISLIRHICNLWLMSKIPHFDL